jgi:hypothetical protein
VAATLLALAAATPAGADPAGPTDYRSELLGMAPPSDAVRIGFVGGDAFLELSVAPGHEVEVTGYQGEPFIRVEPDGTVLEDRATPTWALSQDRFGDVDVPDAGAPPDWQEVASSGRYAWHDHRAHWMGRSAPPGSSPGDQILEAVIPLTVDGRSIDVTVASYRATGPSAWSWLAVALAASLGAVLSVLAVRTGRLVLLTGGAASAALAVGAIAYRSVPPETGPRPSLWVPAALAVAAVLAAAAVGRRPTRGRRLAVHALLGLAGVELVVWAVLRREVIVRAIIPTALPATVDRAVVAFALVVGLVAAAASLARLLADVLTPTERTVVG